MNTLLSKFVMFVAAMLFLANSLWAGSEYLPSETSRYYAPSKVVFLKGGQTITTDDATGYVLAGTTSTMTSSNLAYASTRNVLVGLNTYVTFSGGYIASGYLSSNATMLYYGSSKQALFSPNSLVTFAGGYVSSGYVTSSYAYLPYSSSGSVPSAHVNVAAKVEFSGGYLSKCVLDSAQYLYYGPSRQGYMRGSGVFTEFANNYLKKGVTENAQYLTTASGSQYVAASTTVNFSGGYYTP